MNEIEIELAPRRDKKLFSIAMFCVFILVSVVGIARIIYQTNAVAVATVENVTVQIIGEFWSGSGFVLEEGIVVTAAHVLEDITDARIIFEDGTEFDLDSTTFMVDQAWDVGMARIIDYDGPGATLAGDGVLAVGSDIELVGYPLGIRLWHSFGQVARESSAGVISLDIDGVPGDSGGPCFNSGVVVGILVSGIDCTNMCYVIDVAVIKNTLERYRILHANF